MNPQIQKIHAAADTLAAAADGKRPTLAAVRDALGGGSFTTISEAMKSWRGRHAAPVEPDTTPEAISRAGVELAAALWKQAKAQADEQLKAERGALDEARTALEQETAEAAALADTLTTENDTLKATIEQLQRAAKAQAQELAGVTTRATAAEAALAECRARAEQLEKQLEREAKKADEAAEAAGKAREEAAELRGQLKPKR
jgi:predicted RNase H-like nuclease (RuvC/YqgF family)